MTTTNSRRILHGSTGKVNSTGDQLSVGIGGLRVEAGAEFTAAMAGLIVADYAQPAGYQAGTNPLVDLRLHLGDPVQGGRFNT